MRIVEEQLIRWLSNILIEVSSNNIETSILPYLIRDLFSTKAIIIILASYVTQDILAKWMVVGWYRLPSLVTSTYVGIKQQKNTIFHQKISSGHLTLWKPWPKYFDLPSGNLTQLLKMTIEIVEFPIKNGDFPQLCQFTRGYIMLTYSFNKIYGEIKDHLYNKTSQ